MNTYVLDASALLTSILTKKSEAEEVLSDLFEKQAKGECEIYTIPLFYYEFGNGLRYSLKDQKLIEEVMDRLSQLEIKVFTLNETAIQAAIILATRQNTTVYDTSYHLAAILLKGTMLTCDKKYYHHAEDKTTIQLLG